MTIEQIIEEGRKLSYKFRTSHRKKRLLKDVLKILELLEQYFKNTDDDFASVRKFAKLIDYSASAIGNWKNGCDSSNNFWPDLANKLGIQNSRKIKSKNLRNIVIRPYRKDKTQFEIDLHLPYPLKRRRLKAPENLTKQQALEWGKEQYQLFINELEQNKAGRKNLTGSDIDLKNSKLQIEDNGEIIIYKEIERLIPGTNKHTAIIKYLLEKSENKNKIIY